MNVILISPRRGPLEPAAPDHGRKSRRTRYPSGLHSIAANLEAHGHDVAVVDLEIEDRQLPAILAGARPDVVGITAATANRFQAIAVAREVRAAVPDTVIVAGGPHFTFTAEDTLTHVPAIDVVARGEGEVTMLELLQSLAAGSPRADVAGISYVSGGTVVHNADRTPIQDLDQLPPLNWERIPWARYDYRFMNMPCVSLQTGRGCPINCSFCSTTRMWGKHLRWRDPVRVVDDIAHLLERYPFEAVFFDDDTFTLNRRHLLGICAEIERRGLKFNWICQSRVDTVNRDILATMKRAGCCYVYFGVETGSEKMLASIHKRITGAQVLETVRDCRAVGLLSHALCMYSLPDETDEDRRQTFAFMEELIAAGLDSFSANPTIIYPGTEVEATARARGVLPADFSWSEPFSNPPHPAVPVELLNTPLYTETLALDDLLALKEEVLAMRRPLQTALRAREAHAYQSVPRYLWGFTRVRSGEELRERVRRGQEMAATLTRRGRRGEPEG